MVVFTRFLEHGRTCNTGERKHFARFEQCQISPQGEPSLVTGGLTSADGFRYL